MRYNDKGSRVIVHYSFLTTHFSLLDEEHFFRLHKRACL
jgi:hypothetical protein